MDQDWLADVRKYDAGADENIVGGIVRYCGIALRSENASKVTFDEKEETDRVRDKFLKKKLALTDDDATLDAAIQTVGTAMGGGERNRVSVYYLLTKHFGLLEIFNKPAKGAKKSTKAAAPKPAPTPKPAPAPAPAPAPTKAAAATATTAAAASTGAAAASSAPAAASPTPVATAMSSGGGSGGGGRSAIQEEDKGDDGIWGIAALAGAVMFGAIMFAAITSVWVKNTALTPDPVEETAAAAPAEPAPAPEPTEAAAPEAPDGAGVTASERDGKPMLTVYFDSGSSAVSPELADPSAEVLKFLTDNPDATATISGYNDPSGNAEINARLSKERAENVQTALVAGGVDEGRTELVKPDDTTTTEMSAAEARRVEITLSE